MSVFEEQSPLILSSSAEGKQRGQTLLLVEKKNKKRYKDSFTHSWATKSVMIGTILGVAALSSLSSSSSSSLALSGRGKDKTARASVLGGGETTTSTTTAAAATTTTTSDMVTLTLGCTSSGMLDLLPFSNGGFVGKVGAKLSLKSKDHNFGFQHAIDMAETGCGTYAVAHKLEEGEQFGFYLYDVKNETNYLSDIGAQAIKGGPISEEARNAAVWGAETELATKENASDRKRLEDGIDNIAGQQSLKTNAAAVVYAGKHGFIDPDGNFVAKATAENAKAFEDAQSKGWWPEFSSTTDPETGVTSMNYVDWGAWLKWLVHGNDYSTSEIECDAAAQTCTLQKCDGWECTDYTMPCTEGGRGCTSEDDFTSEVASLGGKKVNVRKYAKKDQQKKKQEQENESNKKQGRSLLWKQMAASTRVAPSLGLGKAYPTRVIVNMAQCTKQKSFGKDEMSGVEFFPRTKDKSNAGNVYLFGQCYNMRDTATCEVPTDHHPSGCPSAPGAAPNTAPNMAQQHANNNVVKTATATATPSATATPTASTATTTSTSTTTTNAAAATPTSTSASTSTTPANPLTDDNIHAAVLACLTVDPVGGNCPDEEWGKMSTWNTKKVTNMDKLFYDPPLADSNDRLSSFNGLIGDWDVSSVTSMSQMFKDADAFTGKNFYKWDTSKVKDMSGMFEHATLFNAQIGGWDVGSVKKMNTMFQNAFSFNQDLSTWDVSSVTDFTRMFSGVLDKGMDQDISMWNVQDGARQNNVTYEAYAFQAKFTCDTEDDGPITSCKPKASSERAASAKLAKAKGAKITREEATRESREFQAFVDGSGAKSWFKPKTWFN